MWCLKVIAKFGLGDISLIYHFALVWLIFELLALWCIGRLDWDMFVWSENTDKCYNRRMIKTSKGYFGLVPAATQAGDIVTLFEGSKVPLVI